MTQTNTPPRTAQSNIEKIVQLEEEDERRRSFIDRFPEMIGSFAGSVTFVVCQLTFVGLWAVDQQRDQRSGWIEGSQSTSRCRVREDGCGCGGVGEAVNSPEDDF